MDNRQEIKISEFKKQTSVKAYTNLTKYFKNYQSLSSGSNKSKILINNDGSFSVYEMGEGHLVMNIYKDKDDWYTEPIGIARLLSNKIFSIEAKEHEVSGANESVYQTLFFSSELPDNERMDLLLFYICSMITYHYDLDIYKTDIHIDDPNSFIIDGTKNEWVYVNGDPSDLSYERVVYVISMRKGEKIIKIAKSYTSDMPTDYLELDLNDFINFSFNELGTD